MAVGIALVIECRAGTVLRLAKVSTYSSVSLFPLISDVYQASYKSSSVIPRPPHPSLTLLLYKWTSRASVPRCSLHHYTLYSALSPSCPSSTHSLPSPTLFLHPHPPTLSPPTIPLHTYDSPNLRKFLHQFPPTWHPAKHVRLAAEGGQTLPLKISTLPCPQVGHALQPSFRNLPPHLAGPHRRLPVFRRLPPV